MESVYLWSAAIGGSLLVLLVLMMLIGGDADADADVSPDIDVGDIGDADPSRVLFELSTKTVIAFVTFFGLAGMSATKAGMTNGTSLAIALGAGAVAFFLVGQAMQALRSLQSNGSAALSSAVGQRARVDLRVPEKHTGTGKVQVIVGGRMLTRKATTAGPAIPTGAEVVIKKMASPDTFEVEPQR